MNGINIAAIVSVPAAQPGMAPALDASRHARFWVDETRVPVAIHPVADRVAKAPAGAATAAARAPQRFPVQIRNHRSH
ncbi:MAG: hypothetical protein SW127_12390 [Actinomycetota bacterium]|nr:hypothetical protein [Actinomycetota bacterium]